MQLWARLSPDWPPLWPALCWWRGDESQSPALVKIRARPELDTVWPVTSVQPPEPDISGRPRLWLYKCTLCTCVHGSSPAFLPPAAHKIKVAQTAANKKWCTAELSRVHRPTYICHQLERCQGTHKASLDEWLCHQDSDDCSWSDSVAPGVSSVSDCVSLFSWFIHSNRSQRAGNILVIGLRPTKTHWFFR